METTTTKTARATRAQDYECFIVVRPMGDNVEIHTVGMSGLPLAEVIAAIRVAIDNAMDRLSDAFCENAGDNGDESAAGEEDPTLDCEVVNLAKNAGLTAHDTVTGLRVTNFYDATLLHGCVSDVLDAANVVIVGGRS